ncbi:MAG: T6SS effector BTH_I2691 family protein [Pseudomonadaceae bacterium]
MTILHLAPATVASLWTAFEDKLASATGQCPLQQAEIAIFPVRYALDEATDDPTQPASHPIPQDWQGQQSLPVLNQRSYTLRQLRDGWLYVVDRSSGTLDEYQVTGATFSKVANANADQSLACANATSHLLYPRHHQLYLAYSSAQWSAWTRERMQDPALQTKWMRALDLNAYQQTLEAPHCAPLRQIGETVADIDNGAPLPGQRFDSTTLPAEPVDAGSPFKRVLGSNTIVGSVPDQDSALFIALDDYLGILDDLGMQAAGPALELSQFEADHLHKLTIAQHVEQLAGVDFSELETSMGLSPEAFHSFKQKAQRYLTAKARYLRELNRPGEFSVVAAHAELSHHQQQLVTEYGQDSVPALDSLVDQWGTRETLRDQVRFEESQTFTLEKEQQLEDIHSRLTPCLQDLITWLKRVGPDPLALFLDQTDEQQCLELIKHADAWLSFLTQDQQAQQWLMADYATPQTLVGLANYNFNAELSSGIEQLVKEFIEQGGISAAVAASAGKRAQEISDVLSNETIRNSAVFQRLSRPAQLAYDTLIQVASKHYNALWQAFEFKLLPAISSRHAPRWKTIAHATISVSVQSLVEETRPFLIIDTEYKQKHAAWMRNVTQLTRRIDAQNRVVSLGRSHDRMAAVRDVHRLKRQLETLMLETPERVLIGGQIQIRQQHSQTIQHTQTIQALVRAELAQQLELKARDYGAYLKRVNDWTKNNATQGLAGLVTILNIWNFHETMTAASADGGWNRNDQLAISTAASSMLASLATMTLIPAWSRISGLTGSVQASAVQPQLTRLTTAAANKWTSGQAYKGLFKSFAMRAISVSAFSVIAAASETLSLQDQIDEAESGDRRLALRIKQVSTAAMAGVAVIQLGASFGAWTGAVSAGAVIAPWAVIALLLAGAVYFATAVLADALKLEGFKLWLHRSSWSKSSSKYWPDTEEGQKNEMFALHETLLRPTLLTKKEANGFWLKLLLPPDVSGKTVTIHPAMIKRGGWLSANREADYRAGSYANYFSQGRWIGLNEVEDWDSLGVRNRINAPWPVYNATEWRAWLVFLPRSSGMDQMEVCITYPPEILKRPDNLGYRFTVELEGISSGRLHANPYIGGSTFHSERNQKSLVIDQLTEAYQSKFCLGVI